MPDGRVRFPGAPQEEMSGGGHPCPAAEPMLATPYPAAAAAFSSWRNAMTNGGNGGQDQNAPPPELHVLAQYIKDFSFENPNAPHSLVPMQNQQQPNIDIRVNVQANPLSDTDFEVVLHVEGKATHEENLMFGIDLAFAGVFRIQNVPQESIRPVVMIECPRLLFPFAREIIANAVRNGGFPPLLLDPVDFIGLYRDNLAAQAEAAQQPTSS
jgi:preprotein translocase subunit SecB